MKSNFECLPDDDKKLKTRIIKLKVSDHQRKTLMQWMHTSRYVYNQTIQAIRSGEKINFYNLRKKLVTKKGNPHLKEWQFKTPKEIRAGAVADVVDAYTTAKANLQAGNIRHFNLGFRTKKSNKNTIVIANKAIRNVNGTIHIQETK